MKKNIIKESIAILLISSIPITQRITGLYVSYFSRAADKEGLDFWENRASVSIK